MSIEDKPAHLIERAAARMSGSWGDVLARRAPVVPTIARLNAQQILKPRAAEPPPVPRKDGPTVTSEALVKAGLIDRIQRRGRVGEEFRIIQSKVVRESFGGNGVATTERNNLILITSALQGEGKSFCALNLAAGIARQGDRRVLLVDADIKPGSLGYLMGVAAQPGLLDLVRSGDRNVEDLIIPTAAENLDVLPLGDSSEASAELFAGKRMADLLDGMSRRYPDRPIILDCAPCLASSNPHALASIVGQVIVVVAAGRTQQVEIETALDLVQGCRHVSMLLNKIAPWNAHSFGSYSYPSA